MYTSTVERAVTRGLLSFLLSGRISFYIQNQGEEALQTGLGKALDKKDHLFCQYR